MTEFPATRWTLLAGIKSPENRAAWHEFVALYRPSIYRMARRRGLQDADAQDVTQVILTQVSSAIERYEPQPQVRFQHWLKRVAKNAIVTVLTRQPQVMGAGGTQGQLALAAQPALSTELEDELSVELMREQYLQAAAVVKTEVNAETWLAFELTALQGATCEVAAQSLGKSVGTIYAARSRIIKRLREQLARLRHVDER